jgi:Uma2 family endonuclease
MALSAHHASLRAYLESDEGAERKSEYHRGVVVAMAGGSVNHARIGLNFGAEARRALRGCACEAFTSDLRVFVPEAQSFFYPDVSIACDPQVQGRDLTNPVVIVEVLSRSTEVYDRGAKFEAYREIESLRHYVLVHQERPMAELFTRADAGRWTLEVFRGLDAVLPLPAVEVEVSLAEVYANVGFGPEPADGDAGG